MKKGKALNWVNKASNEKGGNRNKSENKKCVKTLTTVFIRDEEAEEVMAGEEVEEEKAEEKMKDGMQEEEVVMAEGQGWGWRMQRRKCQIIEQGNVRASTLIFIFYSVS